MNTIDWDFIGRDRNVLIFSSLNTVFVQGCDENTEQNTEIKYRAMQSFLDAIASLDSVLEVYMKIFRQDNSKLEFNV